MGVPEEKIERALWDAYLALEYAEGQAEVSLNDAGLASTINIIKNDVHDVLRERGA